MPSQATPRFLAFVLSCAGVGVNAHARDDIDPRAALRALADVGSKFESLELDLTPDDQASRSSGTRVPHTRIAVHRDGRFAYEEFEPAGIPHPPRAPGVIRRDARGQPADEELRYFVFHDLSSLLTTDGDAGLYFRSSVTEPALSLPPRPQYDLAPWPVLPAIIEQILAHPRITFTRDGAGWSCRALLDHARSFEIAWTTLPDLGPVLHRLERAAPDARFTTIFEGYARAEGLALPTRRIDEASFLQAGERRESRTVRAIRVVAINPADIDDRLRFNPQAHGIRYLDSATGNVHAHEAGPVLYNARELNDAFEREHAQASIFARSWFAGVLAAGAGSLALLWRKLRGRS